MSAMEPLCLLTGTNPSHLTKEENLLLEAELFARICDELKEIFREQYRDYFHLMKFTIEKENAMLEAVFVQLIIQDILSTEEYNSTGIAHYTNTPKNLFKIFFDTCTLMRIKNCLKRIFYAQTLSKRYQPRAI